MLENLLHDVSWVLPYRNEFFNAVFKGFTWLGYPTFIMMLLPLGYWLWNKSTFTKITVLVIISTVLNAYLKDLWQNPRPDEIFHLDPGVGNSFGMPSGHTQIAAVLWFGLAMHIDRRWAWITSLVLVAGIAFSRIYLGVHDLEDILAGLALAAVSLWVYRTALGPVGHGFRNLSVWVHLTLLLVIQTLALWTWPGTQNTVLAVVLAGFLFGWLLGDHFENKLFNMQIRSEWWAKPAVIAVGLAGLVAVLKLLSPIMEGLDEFTAGYMRTTVLGIYMTLIAPALFVSIKLANRGS